MMKDGRRAGFTLAELIVAVAMLAFFSTFIVQMFFKADQLTTRARELDMAVAAATEIADQWKRPSETLVLPEIIDLKNEARPGRLARVFFDADFVVCAEADAVYIAALSLQEKQDDMHDSMLMLRVVICRSQPDDKGPIFSLVAGSSIRGEN